MSYGRGHKLTKEECQRKVSLKNKNIIVLEYHSAIIPVLCECADCGNKWEEPAKNLYRGSNCPACNHRKNNRWTTDSLNDALRIDNRKITVLGEYTGMHTKIECRCDVCERVWSAKPTNLLSGRGCPDCGMRIGRSKQRKSSADFIQELQSINPSVVVLDEYMGAKESIRCSCSVCGCVWSPLPTNLLSGQGCPDCGRKHIRSKQLKSHDEFVKEVKHINANIDVMSEYNGSHNPITLCCLECGETWTCIASNAISQSVGCPTCRASFGEQAISAFLRHNNITYIPQYRFDGLVGVGGALLSYDFFLPEHNVLIEYQGQYHDGTVVWQTEQQLKTQQEHDRRKCQYAQNNSFQLIEIWYWDFCKIPDILTNRLLNATKPDQLSA